ncbi:MAG: translation elongation factor EF-1 subunit alpha [Candidatus Thermoplasmatota archaeon]|nr:translation elongation factor EF-1 subunit alpha [Candidatus Thermoplasmatota archaeon]
MADKPHMNLAIIGHVDHGKSTLVGRILLETGQFPQHMLDKYKEEAKSKGKESFALAWIFDNLKEERERGVTIDVAHKKFDTDKYYFTIIDAPGHRDFVKNMITGTSQADAAILVVAAPDGVMAQTKEHMFLARTLGVKQMIVAINKMDDTKPAYDKSRYETVQAEVQKLAKSVGYKDDQMQYVPVSAFVGDNTAKDKGKIDWWTGDTILQAVDKFVVQDKPTNLPLRWPIQDVYTIKGVGTVPVGKIETGVMKPGQKMIFKPSMKPGGAIGECKTIEMHHEQLSQAVPGDNVGVNMRGISKKEIRRGDVAGPLDDPPMVAKSFKAQIMVLNHPSVITKGYTPVFHCYTAQVACRFDEIEKKLDPRTGQVKEENPDFIKTGDAAIVKIIPTRPMVIESSKKIPQLGRFAIRDMGQTVAAGVCLEVEEAK